MQQPNAHGTRAPSLMQIPPLCYLYLFAASRSYTCAQDGLETVQLVLVASQLAQILYLHSCGHHPLQLALHGGVSPWGTSAFINVHTNEYAQLQLAL